MSQDELPEPEKSTEVPERPKYLLGTSSVLLSLFWIFCWLIPIAYAGSANKQVQFFPRYWRDCLNISCLFATEATNWSTYHLQFQTEANRKWHEIDFDGYFDVDVFGYQRTVDRMLTSAHDRHGGAARIAELSAFVNDRYREKHPDGPRLLALRFVRARLYLPYLAQQRGHFEKPLLESLKLANNIELYRFGEVRFDGKPPSYDHRGKIRNRR